MPEWLSVFYKSLSFCKMCWRKKECLTWRRSKQSKNVVGIMIFIWVGNWVGGIIEGSWFQQQIFIFPSSFGTWESYIGWDSLESAWKCRLPTPAERMHHAHSPLQHFRSSPGPLRSGRSRQPKLLSFFQAVQVYETVCYRTINKTNVYGLD